MRLDEQRQLIGVAQVREVGSTLERRELGAIRQRGKELVRVRVRVRVRDLEPSGSAASSCSSRA